ncbi:MAG: cytochrome P460 family protein [Proteobacteria bacterium]|nr:cytochrome P460 family protein [Pseudomonadota bacterium]
MTRPLHKIQTLAALATIGVFIGSGAALAAQDRSTLKVPNGLSFAEFKGYEDWQSVAVSQTDDSLKLISANPAMMTAYRSGLPANGKLFPEGSRVVKIEWARQPNQVSPYAVQVPGALKSVAFIVKDSKRFPKTKGWAYAKFDVDQSGELKPEGAGAECGFACHTKVAAQDYIFTAYPKR